jgi:hypothetical protein
MPLRYVPIPNPTRGRAGKLQAADPDDIRSFKAAKARCTARAIPNQASEDRGRRRDWMASIPLHGMKVQSDSQRKLSQIA